MTKISTCKLNTSKYQIALIIHTTVFNIRNNVNKLIEKTIDVIDPCQERKYQQNYTSQYFKQRKRYYMCVNRLQTSAFLNFKVYYPR